MKTSIPHLLSLAPRGVIVDETGSYQGLAPWFDTRLLAELLRRYNEHRALADLAEAWARLPADSPATVDDARREAALAISKARSLSALASGGELDPSAPRAAPAGRRSADWIREPGQPRRPGTEPFEPE